MLPLVYRETGMSRRLWNPCTWLHGLVTAVFCGGVRVCGSKFCAGSSRFPVNVLLAAAVAPTAVQYSLPPTHYDIIGGFRSQHQHSSLIALFMLRDSRFLATICYHSQPFPAPWILVHLCNSPRLSRNRIFLSTSC